jgi:hypothetical protein
MEVGEIPGFGNGCPEGAHFGREGQGWRGMDEIGKFREEESNSKDEQGGLKGWSCCTRRSERAGGKQASQ